MLATSSWHPLLSRILLVSSQGGEKLALPFASSEVER